MCTENDDIKLVLFSFICDKHFEKILNIIPQSFPKKKIFCCHNINDLSNTLTKVLFGFGILLIVIRSKNELNKIYQIRERLKDHSIILVLDDEMDELAHSVLQLYPRYISYFKDDYNDIFLVLEKMLTNIKKERGEINARGYRCN